MQRLTPELWAISSFDQVLAAGVINEQTRELDFNLARRSAVVINQIRGMIGLVVTVTTGFDDLGQAAQELDVDPDNLQVWQGGVLLPEAVELDSSRVFRQVIQRTLDTAAGAVVSADTTEQMDWTNLPMEQRPLSITNIRHHLAAISAIAGAVHAEIYIKYFIAELTLNELGVMNASRR